MPICRHCVLNEKFPGISFDAEGVCSHCRAARPGSEAKERYREKFMALVGQVRGKAPYDCLMAFSGGKDSTYTLLTLKRDFGLKILAYTFDNWYQSEATGRNIRSVLAALDVDHLHFAPRRDLFRSMVRTALTQNLFTPKALERSTSVCTTCMAMIRFFGMRMAIEGRIPMVVLGMTPGQAPGATSVFKTNTLILRQMQDIIVKPLAAAVGPEVGTYFLDEWHFAQTDRFPYSVNPLAFLRYDEGEILRTIEPLGWKAPADTDTNSTNCLLNSLANENHLERYGFHPYAMEVATLVRDGVLTREEGLRRLQTPSDPGLVKSLKEDLGL